MCMHSLHWTFYIYHIVAFVFFLPLPGSTLLRFFNVLWGGRVLTAVPLASCWMSGNASQIAAGVEFPATVGLSALWGAVPEYKPPLLLFKPELKILQQGSRKGTCIVVFWFLVVRTLRFAFNAPTLQQTKYYLLTQQIKTYQTSIHKTFRPYINRNRNKTLLHAENHKQIHPFSRN